MNRTTVLKIKYDTDYVVLDGIIHNLIECTDGVREVEIAKETCRECLDKALDKNARAGYEIPPENWSAEIWLCVRLRTDKKCPLHLPSLNPYGV